MPDIYRCQHLTGNTLKVFLALADRIIPPDEDSPGGGTMATAGVVDWALNRMPAELRGKFLLFFKVLNVAGIFFGGRTFVNNSDAAKDRQLRWMESGSVKLFRMGFFGVKTYICMGYYTREELWHTFDYDGPILPERPYKDPVIRDISQGKMEVVA